jgi:hypothetical protein
MRSLRRSPSMIQLRRILLGTLLLALLAGISLAQFGGGRRGWGGGRNRAGEFLSGDEPIQPLPADREGVPNWEVDPHFKSDAFTFVRLRFTNGNRGRFAGGFFNGTATSWLNDWPNADLNFSFRLQQLTSIKVNPDPIQLEITDERLFDFPFAIMRQVGSLEFTDEQVQILRRYLLNGGFLMVDDEWGTDQQNWHEQIKRVFPDREPVELSLDHPIFHCVFDLKTLPQLPTLQMWLRNNAVGEPDRTWRSEVDGGPHFRAIFDDNGHIMVLECANNDIADTWEREGENEEYFHRFSEKLGYPLGINIIFYAMTH